MNHLPTSTAKRGFTLVELIVAMAITIIIVGVLVSVTSIATDTWNRSRSELRASRQAKSMVDAMVRDFEALVIRSGNANEWLSAITEADLPGSAGMSSANASKLIFFTSATDRYNGQIGTNDDLGGDVSCVAYELDYKDPLVVGGEDFETFVLNRLLVDPKETFEKLLGEEDLTTALDSSTVKIENPVNFVCENIYQFTVTFHVEVTDTTKTPAVTSIVPVTLGKDTKEFRIFGNKIDTDYAGTSASLVPSGRVKAVDFSITVLSDMGIDQLRRRTFSGTQQTEFLAKHSYQYSKLVQLPSM
jgi:type II secretory pathway pseudopilin PulG